MVIVVITQKKKTILRNDAVNNFILLKGRQDQVTSADPQRLDSMILISDALLCMEILMLASSLQYLQCLDCST